MLADAPGIERALRMPEYYIPTLGLIAEANAMREAAALYEQQFVDAGRPVDSLAQLDPATEELRESMLDKSRNLGLHVGATAGLERDIQRGRSAVEILETIVRAAFRGNDQLLAEWRIARRVRAVPGGVGPTPAPSDPAPDAPPIRWVWEREIDASPASANRPLTWRLFTARAPAGSFAPPVSLPGLPSTHRRARRRRRRPRRRPT